MSYYRFLGLFLLIPIILLSISHCRDHQKKRPLIRSLQGWPIYSAIGIHVLIALIYTTPWDNYLVATQVWWYDPELVTGIVIGWVPIEEYTFFILQPIMGGLWLAFLSTRLDFDETPIRPFRPYRFLIISMIIIWFGSAALLVNGWKPTTYLALETVWALPPMILQLWFGADILWHYRKILVWSIAPLTIYLSAADTLAIYEGTWTIDPAQSLNIFLGGILPLEEFIFFLFTNTLVIFGITLLLATESHQRLGQLNWWHSSSNAADSP